MNSRSELQRSVCLCLSAKSNRVTKVGSGDLTQVLTLPRQELSPLSSLCLGTLKAQKPQSREPTGGARELWNTASGREEGAYSEKQAVCHLPPLFSGTLAASPPHSGPATVQAASGNQHPKSGFSRELYLPHSSQNRRDFPPSSNESQRFRERQ